jgi:hypothetical protein
MTQILIKTEQDGAVQMHRELGPFEHLLWLVDQWTPSNFALVSRIEGRPVRCKISFRGFGNKCVVYVSCPMNVQAERSNR